MPASKRTFWVMLGLSTVIAAILVITASQPSKHSNSIPAPMKTSAASQHEGIQVELTQAGYDMTKEMSRYSAEANRVVTDELWGRAQEPEAIILSDDTSSTAGVFAVNAITYSGADGNGSLTCQPIPTNLHRWQSCSLTPTRSGKAYTTERSSAGRTVTFRTSGNTSAAADRLPAPKLCGFGAGASAC